METGKQLIDAGADVLVAGSFVFNAPDRVEIVRKLKQL
jgi:ribulose-phosphate 3-epimerase